MCDSTVMDRFHQVVFVLFDDLLLMTEKLLVTHGQQLAFLDEAVILRVVGGQGWGAAYEAHCVEVHVFHY